MKDNKPIGPQQLPPTIGRKDSILIAYREALTPTVFGVAVLVTFVFVVVMAIVGPLGTHHTLSFVLRFVYCGLAGGLDFAISYMAFVFTLRLMRFRTEFQTMLALTLMVVVLVATIAAIHFSVYELYVELHSSLPLYESSILLTLYWNSAVLLFSGTLLVCYVLPSSSKIRCKASQLYVFASIRHRV